MKCVERVAEIGSTRLAAIKDDRILSALRTKTQARWQHVMKSTGSLTRVDVAFATEEAASSGTPCRP